MVQISFQVTTHGDCSHLPQYGRQWHFENHFLLSIYRPHQTHSKADGDTLYPIARVAQADNLDYDIICINSFTC